MSQTVAVAVIIWAVGAGLWALGRSIAGAQTAPSSLPSAMLAVAVIAWLATGVLAWITGTTPARPGVFAGYAATAALMIPLGLPLAGRTSGRQADVARAVIFALLAFVCYRAEAVFI